MRTRLVIALLLLAPLTPAAAQISIQFSLPGVSIGVRQPDYPQLVLVPGYPVYYDPSADSNYFFYDGLYWVYQGDDWYASEWYDGPWGLVEPQYVPVFILRVPVSYYRHPPAFFRGWRHDAPPRWGERWGADWERRRPGWDRWDHRRAPAAAPLPVYQRHYTGDRYPRREQQPTLQHDNYRYAPRDAQVRTIVRRPERDTERQRPAARPEERRRETPRQAEPQRRPEPQRQAAPPHQPEPRAEPRQPAPRAEPQRRQEPQHPAAPQRQPEPARARPDGRGSQVATPGPRKGQQGDDKPGDRKGGRGQDDDHGDKDKKDKGKKDKGDHRRD